MGFGALSAVLVPILLIPLALVVWAWSQGGKKRIHSPFLSILRARPSQALLLAGIPLTVLGELLRSSLPPEHALAGLAFPVIGLVFFVLGTVYAARPLPGWIQRSLEAIAAGLSVSTAQVVFLISAMLFGMVAAAGAGPAQLMVAPAVAIVAWGLALACGLLGAWQPKEAGPRLAWPAVIILGVVVLAALALRAWATNSIPNNLTGDEASGGLFAVDFINGTFNNIFGYGWYSFPAFYFYLQALSISVFGQTTEALRLTSALAGALTVGAVYLAGRALYGKRAGLLAAIVLAGLHFHIHFSRIGLNNIWDGFWFTVVIGLLWVAWQRERRWAFLLAGLGLGFSQYFYASGRMLVVLVPAWLLLAGLADRKRLRRHFASILLMFVVALVAFFPLLNNYLADVDQFSAPMQRVSLMGEWLGHEQELTGKPAAQILGEQMWLSLQAYTNTNLRHWYTPGVPILLPAMAAFFLMGLILMLLQARKPQHWLLWLWLAAITLAGGLSESTPAAQRYIGAAPACALIIGFALNEIVKRLAAVWKPSMPWLAGAAIITAMVMAAANVHFYFWDFTPRGEYSSDNTTVANHLAIYLREQAPGMQVAFFGEPRMGYRSISTLPYLAPEASGVDMRLPLTAPENPPLAAGPTVFVFLPENKAGIHELRTAYPQAVAFEEYGLNHRLLYWYMPLVDYTPQ